MSASRVEPTNTQIIIATFDGTETADEAMKALARIDHDGWVNTADAAVLSRSQDGFVTARDVHESNVLRDTLAGAVVGLLGGPVGAAVGGVAGALGAGAAPDLTRFGLSRADIDVVAAQLPRGSSAIMAAVEPTVANKLMSDLQKLEAKIVRRVVRDAVAPS